MSKINITPLADRVIIKQAEAEVLPEQIGKAGEKAGYITVLGLFCCPIDLVINIHKSFYYFFKYSTKNNVEYQDELLLHQTSICWMLKEGR